MFRNLKPARLAAFLAIGAALLAVVAAVALHVAARALQGRVEQALGPDSEVGGIGLGWSSIEVRQVRIHAPHGWPAADTLRAERIVVVPSLGAILSGDIGIAEIVVDRPYVSALRSADGRLRVVPSLLGAGGGKDSGPAPQVTIDRIELHDAVLEFFDATVRQPPLKIRLEQMEATATDIRLPELGGRTGLGFDGVVKGARHDGKLSIAGWAEFGSRDSDLTTRLRGVDLVALQPYLVKAADAGVRRGTLDLDLHSTVSRGHLHAPGTLTLAGLELDGRGGTFMGLPRQAVLAFMKDRNDRISVQFVLDGNLDDPKFKLNERFATRVASSFADTLGVSIEGIVRGAGTLGEKSVEAVGGAAAGVGKALKGLIRK